MPRAVWYVAAKRLPADQRMRSAVALSTCLTNLGLFTDRRHHWLLRHERCARMHPLVQCLVSILSLDSNYAGRCFFTAFCTDAVCPGSLVQDCGFGQGAGLLDPANLRCVKLMCKTAGAIDDADSHATAVTSARWRCGSPTQTTSCWWASTTSVRSRHSSDGAAQRSVSHVTGRQPSSCP